MDKPKATPNYYLVLGLPNAKATEADIRAHYKKAVLRHHPDKGGHGAQFDLVQTAYTTLNDPARRKEYDAKLLAERRRKKFPSPPAWADVISGHSFALPNGDVYTFETAPERLRSRFRHGDYVRSADGSEGVIIGLSANGVLYWAPVPQGATSAADAAVPFQSFGGESDVHILCREGRGRGGGGHAASAASAGGGHSSRRMTPSQRAANEELRKQREAAARKRRIEAIAKDLSSWVAEEHACRERNYRTIDAYFSTKHREFKAELMRLTIAQHHFLMHQRGALAAQQQQCGEDGPNDDEDDDDDCGGEAPDARRQKQQTPRTDRNPLHSGRQQQRDQSSPPGSLSARRRTATPPASTAHHHRSTGETVMLSPRAQKEYQKRVDATKQQQQQQPATAASAFRSTPVRATGGGGGGVGVGAKLRRPNNNFAASSSSLRNARTPPPSLSSSFAAAAQQRQRQQQQQPSAPPTPAFPLTPAQRSARHPASGTPPPQPLPTEEGTRSSEEQQGDATIPVEPPARVNPLSPPTKRGGGADEFASQQRPSSPRNYGGGGGTGTPRAGSPLLSARRGSGTAGAQQQLNGNQRPQFRTASASASTATLRRVPINPALKAAVQQQARKQASMSCAWGLRAASPPPAVSQQGRRRHNAEDEEQQWKENAPHNKSSGSGGSAAEEFRRTDEDAEGRWNGATPAMAQTPRNGADGSTAGSHDDAAARMATHEEEADVDASCSPTRYASVSMSRLKLSGLAAAPSSEREDAATSQHQKKKNGLPHCTTPRLRHRRSD